MRSLPRTWQILKQKTKGSTGAAMQCAVYVFCLFVVRVVDPLVSNLTRRRLLVRKRSAAAAPCFATVRVSLLQVFAAGIRRSSVLSLARLVPVLGPTRTVATATSTRCSNVIALRLHITDLLWACVREDGCFRSVSA